MTARTYGTTWPAGQRQCAVDELAAELGVPAEQVREIGAQLAPQFAVKQLVQRDGVVLWEPDVIGSDLAARIGAFTSVTEA